MYQPQIINLTASSPVFVGKASLDQIIINKHSSAVISLGNGTSSMINLIHSSMTLGAGERWIPFNGEVYKDGIYFILDSGTANITFQYKPN